MPKKLFSLIVAFSFLSVGMATLNVAPANAVTATIALDCTDLNSLTTNDGWETVTGSGQNNVESSGKQKRLVMNPNDDYTFTFSNCNFYRAVTPANNLTPGSLQLTPNPSNAGTVSPNSWAYGGSSLTNLGVLAGATLPIMPINGANRNYLMATSGSSINVVNPIVIIFIDPTTSADANLSSLMLRDNSFNTITLSPSFSASTTSYTASTSASRVAFSSASPAQFNSPVLGTCRGTALSSSGANCDISTGSNTLTLTVTAPDRTTTKVYTITVTKTDPVAPTIATTSTISNSQANPTVVITSAATSLTSNPSFWSISTGTTGLTWSSGSSSLGTVTFGFTGTATCGGTLTLRANAAAFSPTETLNSNTLSIVVPAGSCSNDATISTSSTVKGVTITSLGTPGTGPNDVSRGSVTISTAQAADTSNGGSFVTSFIKNNANAIVLSTRKAASGTSLSSINSSFNYNGTSAISNGDFFVIQITSQDRMSFNYYVIDVIVGVGSSSSALTFASPSSYDGRFTVQVTNYDSAFTYAVSSSAGQASIDSTGLVTVTGLGIDQSVSVTVTTTRTGYSSASASVSGRSQVAPMAPSNKPVVTLSDTLITCTIGSYSATPTSSAFSLFVDGVHIATNFSALGEYLPDWIIPWATSSTITRTASLTSASWALSDAYKGKKITCATLAYSKNAIGLTASQVMVAR